MELPVTLQAGGVSSPVSVSEILFETPFSEPLIHQVVTAYMAGGRAGTKAQKTRSEVRGGGIKPFKQKGTGRARAGTIRSPLWRKGGIIFAAKPRDFTQKVNKKMYRRAMASVLAELVRQDRLQLLDNLQLSEPKTRDLVAILSQLGWGKRFLLVVDQFDHNLELSARNIPNLSILDAVTLDPVSLISAEKVVMTVAALRQLEEKFS